MSEVLTNNAAAALMFPIAINLAEKLSISPSLMSVAVMLGGSAGWLLPYSYQCNLMVQAAGKYSTKDFMKIGIGMHVSNHGWGNLVHVVCVAATGCRTLSATRVTGPFGVLPVVVSLLVLTHLWTLDAYRV
jgi:Na+/H+ antiporter NhaD/arsenite permease-like protein